MRSEKYLTQIYEKRFSGHENYRNRVWNILINEFFSKWIKNADHILDLGCGYGEFINHARCQVRHAMDLNPKTKSAAMHSSRVCVKSEPKSLSSSSILGKGPLV